MRREISLLGGASLSRETKIVVGGIVALSSTNASGAIKALSLSWQHDIVQAATPGALCSHSMPWCSVLVGAGELLWCSAIGQ